MQSVLPSKCTRGKKFLPITTGTRTSKKQFGLGRLKFWCKTEDKISYEVSDKDIRDKKVLCVVTQGQSKIAESNLLQEQGNPVMRNFTSPSSPQWVHMGLEIHPLPLLAQTRAEHLGF